MSVKKIGEVSSFKQDSSYEVLLRIESTGEIFGVYHGKSKFLPEVRQREDLTIETIKELAQTKPVPVVGLERSDSWLGDKWSYVERLSFFEFGRKEILYFYKNGIYRLDREYSPDKTLLLIMDYEDRERRKFERLRKKFELTQQVERQPRRESIPEEVRIAVWRRDGGKCSRCGSREKLEYDHIIPISKGGSSTVRNVELLCQSCNRKKKDNII